MGFRVAAIGHASDFALKPHINFGAFEKLATDLRVDTEELTNDIMTVVEKNAAIASAYASERAPVFTGEGAGSIRPRGAQLESVSGRIRIRDIVSTNRVQMVVAERGRGRGLAMPPIENLQRWVHLRVERGDIKLEKGQTKKQLAFAIAAAIKRRGLRAKNFMRAAARFIEPQLQADVDRLVRRFERKFERE